VNELWIDLDFGAKTSLYEQIYGYIRRNIMDGRLSVGERLPSTRLLASGLQVSRSTVESAYGQLVSEGYLQAKRGSGYYVCDIGPLYDLTSQRRGRADAVVQGQGRADASPGRQGRGDISQDLINFLPGQIDKDSFPYVTWRRVSREALLDLESDLVLSGSPQGEYAFREEIARYLDRARGVRCVPEQMIVGAGNEYLLQLLGQILGTDRRVAMESPTYLQAYETFRNIGYEVSVVPMDGDGMLVGQIPGKDSLAYVMPSHQFPVGCVMPLKRRAQLLAWAYAGQGRYIIEDDHDSEFRYKGKPIPSLHSMAEGERVIYLGTFSNSIMPSIRVSYMVLPQKLLAAYHERCGFYASTVSRIQQMAVCRFMENGCFERHLNKMRGIYKGKHDYLLQLLKGRRWVRRIYGDNAGLHIVVELKCGVGEAELIARAAGRGLRLQGMSDCYIAGQRKPDAGPVLLLGFGSLSEREMKEGVELLDEVVSGCGGI